MAYAFTYTILGMVSSIFFYLVESIKTNALLPGDVLIKCVAAGAIAAFLLGIFRELINRSIPIFQSWLLLLLLFYFIPYINMKVEIYWTAAAYGYIAPLLWEAYNRRLPKI